MREVALKEAAKLGVQIKAAVVRVVVYEVTPVEQHALRLLRTKAGKADGLSQREAGEDGHLQQKALLGWG